MRNILDPADRWIGTPGTLSVFGNKPPVAVRDTLSVLSNSGAVTINVLANDFDPEGGALTLVSASAALGTAVAETNGTVTYTPFPGISGFDTVLYDVEDPEGQRRTGQIDIAITEPRLSIDAQPDNTLVIDGETGLLDITITTPARFSGTYQVDSGALMQGPLNLVPPAVTGTVTVGQTLAVEPGLWIYETSAGAPVSSWQWRRAGTDIPGETGTNYAVQASDSQAGISVAETETDAFGQRTALSATVASAFTPADDLSLLGWWDAGDATTIFQSAGIVSGWADKVGGPPLGQANTTRRPSSGIRTINGRNAIDFNGSQFLERAETVPVSGNLAFHMVIEIDSTASSFEAILAVDATNDFQLDSNSATQFNGRLNMTGIGTTANLTGGPFVGLQIVSTVFDRTGAGQAEVFVSNISRLSTAYTLPIDSAATLILMANRSKNAWVNGAVGELIVTGDVTNRAQHHAYLAAKWGIA